MATIKQYLLVAAACSLLAACAPSVAVRPSTPLTITRTHYIPLPPNLLQPCLTAQPAIRTWGDLAQAYIGLRASYASCAAEIDAIRSAEQPACTPPLQCNTKTG